MESKLLNKATKLLQMLAGLGAVYYLILYILIVLLRIRYPFELEWMEGGSVDHIRRILEGKSLYVEPSLDFVPYIYTPLYFYVSAGISKITGVGFLAPRLVSFLSSLGSLALIFEMIRKETKSPYAGLIAAGLFAATFRIAGAWFDLARVDSLFLFLLLSSIYFLRFGRSRKELFLSGLLLWLSFFTKQTAMLISLPLMLYSLITHKKQSLWFIGPWLLLLTTTSLLFNMTSHGWYSYYVFDLPGQHWIIPEQKILFWKYDILEKLPYVSFLGLVALLYLLMGKSKEKFLFYFLTAVGLLGGSLLSRMHSGGYDNVLIPAYAALALLLGLSFRSNKTVLLFTSLLLIIQWPLLSYPMHQQIPTKKDREAGQKLVRIMSELPGDLFIPWHGYLPSLAGKKTHAQWFSIFDILRAKDNLTKIKLTEEIVHSLKEKKFQTIILNNEPWFERELSENYQQTSSIFNDPTVFWPVTGGRTRPESIYSTSLAR